MDIQVSLSTGVGAINDEFWSSPLQDQREFFLLTFLMLMRRHGLYGLHAGAVSRAGSGCLIVGRSGKGKTNLTIALVKEGWDYLSDAAAVLRQSGEDVQALAFRHGFSLTPHTVGKFPELENTRMQGRFSNGKRSVDVDSIYPGQFTYRCKPRMIIFPDIVDRRRSRLVQLDKLRTLTLLIEQSPGIMTGRALVEGQLAALKLLVEQAGCYRLMAGIDVFEEPSAVSQLVLDAQVA